MKDNKVIVEKMLADSTYAKAFARDPKNSLRLFHFFAEELRKFDVDKALELIVHRDKAGLFRVRPTNIDLNPRSLYTPSEIRAVINYSASIGPLYHFKDSRRPSKQETRILAAITKLLHNRWRKPLGLTPMSIPSRGFFVFTGPISGDTENARDGETFPFHTILLKNVSPQYRWAHLAIHEIVHAYGFGKYVDLISKVHRKEFPCALWALPTSVKVSTNNTAKSKLNRVNELSEGLVELITQRTMFAIPSSHPVLGSAAVHFRKVARVIANSHQEKYGSILAPSGIYRDEQGKVVPYDIYINERGALFGVMTPIAISLRHIKKLAPREATETALRLMIRAHFSGESREVEILFDAFCGRGSYRSFDKIEQAQERDDFLSKKMRKHFSGSVEKQTMNAQRILTALKKNKRVIDEVLRTIAKYDIKKNVIKARGK